MSWWRDILRQSVFMCIFIVLIPIGAYTIHSGSSAIVAVVSYLFLSLVVPRPMSAPQMPSLAGNRGESAAGPSSWSGCSCWPYGCR